MEELMALVLTLGVVTGVLNIQPDNRNLELGTITTMVTKCKPNGGLKYIEHDYDVVCMNGAEFSTYWVDRVGNTDDN